MARAGLSTTSSGCRDGGGGAGHLHLLRDVLERDFRLFWNVVSRRKERERCLLLEAPPERGGGQAEKGAQDYELLLDVEEVLGLGEELRAEGNAAPEAGDSAPAGALVRGIALVSHARLGILELSCEVDPRSSLLRHLGIRCSTVPGAYYEEAGLNEKPLPSVLERVLARLQQEEDDDEERGVSSTTTRTTQLELGARSEKSSGKPNPFSPNIPLISGSGSGRSGRAIDGGEGPQIPAEDDLRLPLPLKITSASFTGPGVPPAVPVPTTTEGGASTPASSTPGSPESSKETATSSRTTPTSSKVRPGRQAQGIIGSGSGRRAGSVTPPAAAGSTGVAEGSLLAKAKKEKELFLAAQKAERARAAPKLSPSRGGDGKELEIEASSGVAQKPGDATSASGRPCPSSPATTTRIGIQAGSSGLQPEGGAPERGAGSKHAAEEAPRARHLDDALSDCFPENARGLAEAVARSRNAIWTLQTRPGRGAYVAVILFSIFLRLRIGQHPHSGERTPPMYGDFEAQRHWIEVTSHVPLTDWYQGKTRHNELQFWGLDYPPLTAYHSWLIGKVYYALKDAFEDSQFISRSTSSSSSSTSVDYFALFTSRGDEHCKAFMRLACLFTDLLLYVTACCFYCEKVLRDEGLASFPRLRLLAFFLLANAAPVLFIDHGHFQFNTVALGCVLWAVNCVYYERRYLGSVFYVCALLYKQTTLYYAPAFFLYLLGEALRDSFGGRGDAREREDIVLELVADWTHLDTLGIEEGLSPSSNAVDAGVEGGDILEAMASARSRRGSSSQIAKIRLRTSGGGSSRRKKKPLSLFRFVFRIARLGVTVLFTAGLILYPFRRQLLQVKNRVFPFGRGIFEDYVGNLWALLSPVLKLRELTRDESSIYQTAAAGTDEHGGSYLDFGQSALQGVIAEMSTAYGACSSEVFYTANSLGPRTAKAELASLASVKLAVFDMPLCISGNFLVPQLSALLSPEKISTFAHGIILQVFQSPLLASKRQLIFALSLSLTLAGAFGAGFVSAFKKPNHRQFLRALIGSSLSFYLFSWQVHEKAILLPLLPVLLQLPLLWVDQISATSKAASCDVVWRNLGFLLFAHFSLLPLAYKDKNALLHFQLALFTLFLAAFFHGSGAPQEVRRFFGHDLSVAQTELRRKARAGALSEGLTSMGTTMRGEASLFGEGKKTPRTSRAGSHSSAKKSKAPLVARLMASSSSLFRHKWYYCGTCAWLSVGVGLMALEYAPVVGGVSIVPPGLLQRYPYLFSFLNAVASAIFFLTFFVHNLWSGGPDVLGPGASRTRNLYLSSPAK